MDQENYIPSQGLIQDKEDNRDFKYTDLLGGENEVDWEKGFNVYEDLGLNQISYDQGPSMSCVGQATAMHFRCWHKKLVNEDQDFSRRFIYSQISAGLGAGASLRDGVRLVSTLGDCKESSLPSYEKNKPPSEEFMFSKAGITSEVLGEALPFDRFTYRVIPGYTTNINVFAHAIQNNNGAVGGFTGTNGGWCRPVIEAPKVGEKKWGHAVFLSGFGVYEGKKCLFTPNSWGGRYTIKEGRWKGFQAIPEDYFLAGEQTAVGLIPGAYVFNAWVLVPDEKLTPNQKLMDFLKKNEGRLVQDVEQSGGFALVKNGKLLVASKDRVAELVAAYLVKKEGVAVPKDLWNGAVKENF